MIEPTIEVPPEALETGSEMSEEPAVRVPPEALYWTDLDEAIRLGPGAADAAAAEPPAKLVPDREGQPWWAWALFALVIVFGGIAVAATYWPSSDVATGAGDLRADSPASTANTTGPDGGSDARTPSGPDGPPTSGAGGATATFEEVVAGISRFVEEARELEFKRPVVVELVDDEEFLARLFEDLDEQRDEIERTEGVLRALGLLERDDDLFQSNIDILGAGVVGFYDAETDELVVRGTEATPFVRKTIAHELVHALDDQHFELHRPELDDALDEEGFGFQTLVEGNASVVEDAYVATFTSEERAQALREELEFAGNVDFGSFPRFVLEVIVAPYELGPILVEAILDAGGRAALDAAFSDPPDTSEQVLDPTMYVTRENRLPVEAPPAEGEVFEEGVFGQLVLLLLLANEVTQQTAFDAAIGWGGDWYVAWEEPNRTCIRIDFVGDTDRDTAQIGDALTRWADEHGRGTTVEQVSGRYRLTACS